MATASEDLETTIANTLAVINAINAARLTGDWENPLIPVGAKPNTPGGADHARYYEGLIATVERLTEMRGKVAGASVKVVQGVIGG